MVPSRVENPRSVELQRVEEELRAGQSIIVQFSEVRYTPELLRKVDSLCATFGERLEVRFYGHSGPAFTCSTLEHIPSVASLSIDCLQRAGDLEALGGLRSLRRLSVGIFDLDDQAFLRFPNLRSLRSLAVGSTRSSAVDLSFLDGYSNLERLRISGHTRGLNTLAGPPSLTKLDLACIGKGTSLGFLSGWGKLRSLGILLGGRASIAEIEAPDLEELAVDRVRGLAELGDLARFPELTSFSLEDQIRFESLTFSPLSAKLRTIRIINCKSLRRLSGLDTLPWLEHLRVSRTGLDPEALLALGLPPSLKIFAFYTGKQREDRKLRALLESRGYQE